METAKVEAIFRGERLIRLRSLLWIVLLTSLWIALPIKETLSKTSHHEFRVGTALSNHSTSSSAYIEAFTNFTTVTRFFDFGTFIGLGIAICADIFGRKWTLLASLLSSIIGGVCIDLFQFQSMHIIGFILQGMGYSATLAISIVLTMESIPRRLHPISMLLFSLSILDHYLYHDILINFGNKFGGHMMSVILVALTLLIFRFTDESLSFLISEGTSSQLEEWIYRANIVKEDDTLELENHDVNEVDVENCQVFDPNAQEYKQQSIFRFTKSFTYQSAFSLRAFILFLIISFHLHAQFANFKIVNAHQNHTLEMEFFGHELPALIIILIISFTRSFLPSLIGLQFVMLAAYGLLGITSNAVIWYIARISNTSSILILPFIAIPTYPLRHRCTFLLLTLLGETYSEYLDKILAKHRGSSQLFSWINMFLIICLIVMLLFIRKKTQPRT